MREDLYVVDTCALISYFSEIFDGDVSVTKDSLDLIDLAFHSTEVKLIFPSAVFIEIFIKWFKNEEIASQIKYEIYFRIKERENCFRPLISRTRLYKKNCNLYDNEKEEIYKRRKNRHLERS